MWEVDLGRIFIDAAQLGRIDREFEFERLGHVDGEREGAGGVGLVDDIGVPVLMGTVVAMFFVDLHEISILVSEGKHGGVAGGIRRGVMQADPPGSRLDDRGPIPAG